MRHINRNLFRDQLKRIANYVTEDVTALIF